MNAQIQIPEECVPQMRVDKAATFLLPEFSRTILQRAIQQGNILLNGHPCRCGAEVRPGDVLQVNLAEEERGLPQPEQIPLDILWEDSSLLVINKPAGVVVHPAPGNWHGTVVNALLGRNDPDARFAEMLSAEDVRPGIVHRLDRDTSGALLVAKNPAVRDTLKAAFQQHQVKKTYLAIVVGEMNPPAGEINLPVGRHPTHRLKWCVRQEGGKEALTEYQTIAAANGCSLVRIRLHTGRTHQIRVHFSHAGHPVLGDALYGSIKTEPYAAQRQLLHAWKLAFTHPVTGEIISLKAPIPADFKEAVKKLSLEIFPKI